MAALCVEHDVKEIYRENVMCKELFWSFFFFNIHVFIWLPQVLVASMYDLVP